MEAMIQEWVRLKVALARTNKGSMTRCGAVTRHPIKVGDAYRIIEAVEVRTCGERSHTCPACLEKLDARFAERRRDTDKAARLWKKILKDYQAEA